MEWHRIRLVPVCVLRQRQSSIKDRNGSATHCQGCEKQAVMVSLRDAPDTRTGQEGKSVPVCPAPFKAVRGCRTCDPVQRLREVFSQFDPHDWIQRPSSLHMPHGAVAMATGPWRAWLPLDYLDRLAAPRLRPLRLAFGRRRCRTGFVARRAAEDLEPFRLLERARHTSRDRLHTASIHRTPLTPAPAFVLLRAPSALPRRTPARPTPPPLSPPSPASPKIPDRPPSDDTCTDR